MMNLSVIIPVHNAERELRECLLALQQSTRPPHEILVVDDASADDSALVAQELGACVIQLEGDPHGPALARNCGAQNASGNVLVFLDADVCVHADTLQRIEEHFVQEPDVAALFGSYDDSPPAPNLISGYYNLRHHWTHQHAAREAWTFWSGCGAVRREVFLELGGFDTSYERPSVEDIAFGRALRRNGYRVRLCPDVQATHLKQWTLRSWLRTDIWSRAVPWTQMLLAEADAVPNDLNLDWKSRLSAVAAWLAVLFFAAGFGNPLLWAAVPLAFGALIVCNWPLLVFFAQRRGVWFAVGAGSCHALYYLYSSAIFALFTLGAKLRLDDGRWRRAALPLLLLAAVFKGLAWSLIVPAWQAPDEPQHFLYAHEIARQRSIHIAPDEWVPADAWRLAEFASFWRAASGRPLDLANTARVSRALQSIDGPAVRQQRVPDKKRLITVKAFVRYHPPSYYSTVATVMKPLQNASVRWRLLAGRWLSVGFGLLTVGLAVAIGREIWPQHEAWALLLGALVAFQPMNAFTQAYVTNDAPLIALFSAVLFLGLLILRRGMSTQLGLVLGLTVAMGLLVKMSFLCVVPLLGGLMMWRIWRERRVLRRRGTRSGFRRHAVTGWLLVWTIPALLSSWWYVDTLGGGSRSFLRSSFVTPKPAAKVGTSAAAKPKPSTSYDPAGLGWEGSLRKRLSSLPVVREVVTYTRVLVSYWGNFGWVTVRVPTVVWVVLALMTVSATAGTMWNLMQRKPGRGQHRELKCSGNHCGMRTRQQRRALWWLGAGSLALIAFYVFVDWQTRISTGGPFGIRGGYYLPAIAGQMAWLMLGIAWSNANRLRAALLLTCGMVMLNFYCLFEVVGHRYYGEVSLLQIPVRAAILQPVSSIVLSLLCLSAIVASVALVLALLSVVMSVQRVTAPRRLSSTRCESSSKLPKGEVIHGT